MAWSPLASLYAGADLGQAFSGTLGRVQAETEDVNQQVRGQLLQTAVATGKLNPASLSQQDASLLGAQLVKPPHAGGVLSNILGTVEAPFKVALNTAGDFVNAVEGVPQGLLTLGEAAYRSVNPVANAINSALGISTYKTPKGPGLGDIGKQIAQSTVHDFTHFDPNHPLYPLLDLASVASLGAAGAVRGSAALSRLADVGQEGSLVKRVGEAARGANESLNAARTPRLISPSPYSSGVEYPEVPISEYSLSPFHRFLIQKPIDAFFQTKLANSQLPGFEQGTTINDVRNAYHIRKIANLTRGRASSTAVNETTRATQGFNQALHDLGEESHNEAVAAEKFNALVLMRKLGLDNATPEDRLATLDQYRDKVLATGAPHVEGVPDTEEGARIREFYRKLTTSSEFRKFFSEPTPGMLKVRDSWDEAILNGMKSLNIDPHEVLNRAMGPLGHVTGKTPEELLREQPAMVQAQSTFARASHDLEQAIREAGNKPVDLEDDQIKNIASTIPGYSLNEKLRLVRDAVASLRADIGAAPRGASYIPGKTLAQKLGTAMHDQLGMDQAIAEKFAAGGFTNYFPESSALGLHPRPYGGPLGRAIERIPGVDRGATRVGLREYHKGSQMRLIKAETLGVAPFASFLEQSGFDWFRAGVDRRDPITFVRHIQQRERVLAHQLLTEPLLKRLVLKDDDGRVLTFQSEAELTDKLGSTVATSKWRLLPPAALQKLVMEEDKGAQRLAEILDGSGGKFTPEAMNQMDGAIDESAQDFVRQLTDEVIAKKDGMVAVPVSYFNNLINHAKILDSAARGPLRLWQAFINRWRSAVLAYMPSWVLRTSIGHGVVLFIGGVWNPIHYVQAMHYFGEGFKVPGTDVEFSKGLERHVPAGVEQGSPHSDFSHYGSQRVELGKMAQITTGTVHRIMNIQRRAAFLHFLRKSISQDRFDALGNEMKIPGGFVKSENIDRVINERPDLVHKAIGEIEHVSYTFGQMSPWERRLAKNLLPFWGWYKFVSKFVWSLPLTYPGRTLLIARLGQLGESEMGQLGPMPDWLRSAVMFNTHNLAAAHYISMLGLNPLGDVMDPAGGFQGLVRLGQMSPIIQAGLEGAGYNTLTGGLESIDPSSGIVEVNGKFINLHTGHEYDSLDQASVGGDVGRFVGGLAREFPEIRIGELAVTGGRPIYPESIPLINERIIPSTNPPKDVSPAGIALQYMGVAPKTYNLQKYQVNLLKDITRARSSFNKAIVKEKALK